MLYVFFCLLICPSVLSVLKNPLVQRLGDGPCPDPQLISYSKNISAVPRAYYLFQEHIRYSKSISAIPKAYQLFQEHISYSKSISDIPRAYQISQEHIIFQHKSMSLIKTQYQMLRCCTIILHIRKDSENKIRFLGFLRFGFLLIMTQATDQLQH